MIFFFFKENFPLGTCGNLSGDTVVVVTSWDPWDGKLLKPLLAVSSTQYRPGCTLTLTCFYSLWDFCILPNITEIMLWCLQHWKWSSSYQGKSTPENICQCVRVIYSIRDRFWKEMLLFTKKKFKYIYKKYFLNHPHHIAMEAET